MASPNIKGGYNIIGPNKILLSRGSGATMTECAVPGARELTLDIDYGTLDWENAESMTVGKVVNSRTVSVKFTAGGWNAEFTDFLHSLSSSTAGADDVDEEVAVTTGTGALSVAPVDDDYVCCYDSDGVELERIFTGVPAAGEFSVAGTVLTLNAAVTGTFRVIFSGANVAGLKSVLTANLPCEVDMYAWGPVNTMDGECDTGTTKSGYALILKNIVFDGSINLLTAKKDNDGSYEISGTANIRTPATDLVLYQPLQ
ncbi:MAG: hypothetical protein GY832_30995 [Chloroflexi bacterium]|nr:hypothetical protein [Chloroflexota bacterium]